MLEARRWRRVRRRIRTSWSHAATRRSRTMCCGSMGDLPSAQRSRFGGGRPVDVVDESHLHLLGHASHPNSPTWLGGTAAIVREILWKATRRTVARPRVRGHFRCGLPCGPCCDKAASLRPSQMEAVTPGRVIDLRRIDVVGSCGHVCMARPTPRVKRAPSSSGRVVSALARRAATCRPRPPAYLGRGEPKSVHPPRALRRWRFPGRLP